MRGCEGSTPAERPQPSRKMRSERVLRKQLCFPQRLQKPTPCLPLHIFAAEGETVGNGSFPDVTGMRPVCYRKTSGSWLRKGWVGSEVTLHRGCGLFAEAGQVGPQGSELTQLSPVSPAMESSSPKTRAYGEWRFRERGMSRAGRIV